jgi:hypothetical protein
LAVAPGIPIWHVSQSTRRFWIISISPRQQHSSSAPMMRREEAGQRTGAQAYSSSQGSRQQRLFFARVNTAVSDVLLLFAHRDAEAMKRRLC